MTLARFVAEVRTARPDTHFCRADPIGLISRVGLHPHTLESTALRKPTLAVIST